MAAKDMAMLVLLAALWGSSFLFIRIAVPAFGPIGLVATRLVLAALMLGGYAVALRRRLELRPFAGRLLILGAMNAALPFTLISAAELQLTASMAALLNSTAPLFASVFGAALLGERFTASRGLGLVAGMLGVAVMVGWSPMPLNVPTLLGVAAMLVATASYAASGFFVRLRLAGVPTHTLALGQQLGALAWLALPALVWTPPTLPPPAALWSVFALAALSTTVAYLLYFRLLERVGPTKASTVTYLLPAFGVLWGALFLREPVTGGMAIGFVLVLISLVLVNGVRLPVRLRLPRVSHDGEVHQAAGR